MRTGEGCPGIQQASEWPNSLHSVVQFPVIATSGRERISVGTRERERANNPVRETFAVINVNVKKKKEKMLYQNAFVNRNCVIRTMPKPTNPPPPPSLMSLQLLLSSQQQLLCSCCYALCNEHYCAWSPLGDVMHLGDAHALSMSFKSIQQHFVWCVCDVQHSKCIDF